MQRTTQTGFTLTELLITIALLAIMAQIALPAWQEFISKNRSQALMHSVESAIHHARSMAVTHRIKTELCGSLDQNHCHSDWSKGWLIREAAADAASQNTPLHIHSLDEPELKLQWAGFQQRIIFHNSGLSSASNGRFFVCRKQQIDWQLVLNRQGRLRRATEQENRNEDRRCL